MNGFNDRLIEARERAGYSQTQLGEACDMASTQISRYESGRAMPRRATVKRLASALGVSEEWLVTGSRPSGQFLVKTVLRESGGLGLDLRADPDTERAFNELANLEGLTPGEFLKKLVLEHLEKLPETTRLRDIAERVTRLEQALELAAAAEAPKKPSDH